MICFVRVSFVFRRFEAILSQGDRSRGRLNETGRFDRVRRTRRPETPSEGSSRDRRIRAEKRKRKKKRPRRRSPQSRASRSREKRESAREFGRGPPLKSSKREKFVAKRRLVKSGTLFAFDQSASRFRPIRFSLLVK